MPITDALLPEFDHEMGVTRRVLERVPEVDFGWKPHDKSMSLGRLATHVASIPHWTDLITGAPVFDMTGDPETTAPKVPPNQSALLEIFDRNVGSARARLAALTDAELMVLWTFKKEGQTVFSMPRIAALRAFVMNHSIHHRGQLSVYLRLRNVPVPAMYGPSADEG